MHTIVVGVDGSKTSLRALSFAARLVDDMRDTQLVVAHARWLSPLWFPPTGQEEFGTLLDRVEELAREAVDRELQDHVIDAKFVTRAGDPCDVIDEIAGETDATFVVVGRRGWSTARELIMGSVSNRLVHKKHAAVLLVP